MNVQDRINYLDIAKGILIIFVVLGHSDFENRNIIFWFHMPAFFIISGMLYKGKINFKKLLLTCFVPYILYSIINIGSIYYN